MLYRVLLKLKERYGLTDDLKSKIDIFLQLAESQKSSTMI